MAEIIDLALVAEANRVLGKFLDTRGIRWFMANDGPRLLALDKAKVEMVVKTARRARERKGATPVPQAVEHCRTLVRRDLIRRVAMAMLQTGC